MQYNNIITYSMLNKCMQIKLPFVASISKTDSRRNVAYMDTIFCLKKVDGDG